MTIHTGLFTFNLRKCNDRKRVREVKKFGVFGFEPILNGDQIKMLLEIYLEFTEEFIEEGNSILESKTQLK